MDHALSHPAILQWDADALAENWHEDCDEAEVGAGGQIVQDDRRR